MSPKTYQFINKNFKSIFMICTLSIFFFAVISNSANAQGMHAVNLMPVYPAGIGALKDTVFKNLHYPEAALKTGISGTVLVNFTIDPEGKVQNIKVMQGLSPECDAEAVRVTGLLKGWSPGIRQGKPVNITVSLPVEFKSDKKLNPLTVSGKVTEKTTGKPIEGALVIVKDTNVGSVTNAGGAYSIDLPVASSRLIIFSVGYSSKEISIDFHSTINVELETEYYVLDFKSPEK
jgi:protein TonB